MNKLVILAVMALMASSAAARGLKTGGSPSKGKGAGIAGVSLGTKTIPGFSFSSGGGSITQGGFVASGPTKPRVSLGKGKTATPAPAGPPVEPAPGKFESIPGKVENAPPTTLSFDPPGPSTPTIIHWKEGSGPEAKADAGAGASAQAKVITLPKLGKATKSP